MYRILFTLIVLLFCFSAAAAQKTDESLSKPDSTRQTEYSESSSYKPREIEFLKPKERKNKKPKKDSVKIEIKEPNAEITSKPTNVNRTIRIPLFVYDKNRKAVTDLQSSDIKVFVDDREQEISAFKTANPPLNILLVLDTSPSLAYKENDLRNVVSEMIKALKPGDKIQIIKFNQELSVLSEPTNDPKVLEKAVKKVKIGDGTSLYDAMQTVYNKILVPNAEPPIIILLTDGVDTTSQKANFVSSLVEAEKFGVVVFPFYFDSFEYFQKNKPPFPISGFGINTPKMIGATKEEYELGRAYLHDIAELSGGTTFQLKDLSQVKKEDFEAAFKFIIPQYYISINPTQNADTFQRKQIKVRINRPNLSVQARGSYIIGEN